MKKSVLFVCTANSARSQMAEALLKNFAGDDFDVLSAGNEPGSVDPRALDALNSFGIDTSGLKSKSVESVADRDFDFVITLCDKAHKECRYWPDSGVVMAWDFPDPKASPDPKAFIRTMQELSERIRLFVLVNTKNVSSQVMAPSALDFYKAMADETRLLSLLLIHAEDELCVCELMEALALPQPKVSRHLSQLKKAGMVLDRRQGQWVYYKLHPLLSDWMLNVIKQTEAHSAEILQQPFARLAAMCDRPSEGGEACQ